MTQCLTIGSLFTGYGGLDMAAESVTGARTVWHCENDPAASRLLTYRFPDVPNHGNITRVDWTTVEPVDILTAGWPCQPFSQAGKRKGAADERALWPYVADAVRMVRPRLVFLENVPAVVTAGELARATASLAALGYVGSWTCLRAADIGAPHRRERCFIIACHTDSEHRNGRPAAELAREARPAAGSVADATGDGRYEGWSEPAGKLGRSDVAERGAALADAERDGCHRDLQPHDACWRQPDVAWGGYAPAIRRWEHVLGRVAPAPTEPGRKGAPRLSPRLVEWMMGLPEGWVTDVPGIARNAQLRMLGNGVVPQQAAAALWGLLTAEAVAA